MLISMSSFLSNAADIPCFTPSASKACLPVTITLDPSCSSNTSGSTPLYNYDYTHNPTNFVATTSHTYTTAGTYTIRQIIGNTGNYTQRTVVIVDAPKPAFTLQSCINLNVNVTITDTIYDKFIVDFGDGSPTQTVLPASVTNHIYSTSNTQTITVMGVFLPNTSCGSGSQSTYTFVNLTKPDLVDLTVLSQNATTGSIQLRFNGVIGHQYKIQRSTNGGAYTTITTMKGVGALSFTDINLNTQANVYQYQVVAFDDCVTTVASDVIYSLIMNAIASPGLNTVNWNGSASVSSFALTKNSVVQTLTTPTSTSFTDNIIVCGGNYCYQNTASLNTNTASGAPQKSYSSSVCVVGLAGGTGPTAVTNLNATIQGNASEISWDVPVSVSTYTLYQSVNGSAFSSVAQPTSTPFTYNLSNTSDDVCYQIDYIDKCARLSPKSLSTCPVTLKDNLSGNLVTLNWNTYSGFDNTGVQSYVVQKLDENGNVISETNVGSATTYSETVNFNQPYLNFRIKVIPQTASYTITYSNDVILKFEAQLFIPDIFTPNGDGVNDAFIVKAKFVKTYSISIFSRWGEVVYASSNIVDRWNGMNNNNYAVDGAYTYKIIATDIKNNEFVKTGTVTLSR